MGNNYWAAYIGYVVANFGYGDKTTAGSGRLLDHFSNQRYRIPKHELKIGCSVGFFKLNGVGREPSSAAVDRVGQLQPGGPTFRDLALVYDGRRYRARVGLVPRPTGVFALYLLSLKTQRRLRLLDPPPGPDGRPRVASLQGAFFVINDGETHSPLYRQHTGPLSTQPNPNESNILAEQKSTYTFVVR